MRVFLHEIIHTVPGQEEPYMASVLANSVRVAEEYTGRPDVPAPVWYFRTAEVSGVWPKVINLHSAGDWQQKAAGFKRQFTDARDTGLEEWWNRNLTLRTGGFDRMLLPTDYTPEPDDLLRAGVKGRVFLHEIIKVIPGEVPAYLTRLERDFLPVARERGWQLIGAYRVSMRPREALTVWGMREWSQLADLLAAREAPDLRDWFAYRDQVVTCSEEMVLLPGRVNPLHLGD